jgi:hypothetical protein
VCSSLDYCSRMAACCDLVCSHCCPGHCRAMHKMAAEHSMRPWRIRRTPKRPMTMARMMNYWQWCDHLAAELHHMKAESAPNALWDCRAATLARSQQRSTTTHSDSTRVVVPSENAVQNWAAVEDPQVRETVACSCPWWALCVPHSGILSEAETATSRAQTALVLACFHLASLQSRVKYWFHFYFVLGLVLKPPVSSKSFRDN